MVDANEIRAVYARYPGMMSKGDVEGILALYADDATIEDPIGSEPRSGKAAIREFYEASAGTVTIRLTGPVRVAGCEAATPMVVLMGPEGEQQALDVISVMKFTDDGLIQSMRAFWSFDTMRPATAADLG
ncbi:MAG: nuclear transport factor 2 family protein [Myxococcales bacterium]|nr:nuclear transport factor 2 family protein [Myxococcales bacterium]